MFWLPALPTKWRHVQVAKTLAASKKKNDNDIKARNKMGK